MGITYEFDYVKKNVYPTNLQFDLYFMKCDMSFYKLFVYMKYGESLSKFTLTILSKMAKELVVLNR